MTCACCEAGVWRIPVELLFRTASVPCKTQGVMTYKAQRIDPVQKWSLKNCKAMTCNRAAGQNSDNQKQTRPIASENRCKLYPPEENSPESF